MLRESFKKHLIGANKEFRHRGEEPGRLENFSDAVFALAITLLLISTSPPTNFEQIRRFVWELIPFTLCITVIISIWHGHFVFFYRYGLRHGGVILLNTIFLVIVLFYVYPLKFLTKMSLIPITLLFGEENIYQELSSLIRGQDWGDLMIIYGLGASSGFFVLMLMYRFALKKAKELDLNEIEVFDTKDSIRTYLLLSSVPLVSVLIAIILYDSVWAPAIAGPSYMLYPIVMWIYGVRSERKRNKLLAGLTQAEPVLVHSGSEAEP